MREFYGFLRLANQLVNPFGHPSQVRTQVLVLQTCVDLRRLASLFGQGFHLSRCTHSTENYQTYGVTCASPARSNSFHIIPYHISFPVNAGFIYALWIWRSVLPYYSVAMSKVHTPRMGLIVKLCLFAILLQQGKSDKSSGPSSISAVNFS